MVMLPAASIGLSKMSLFSRHSTIATGTSSWSILVAFQGITYSRMRAAILMNITRLHRINRTSIILFIMLCHLFQRALA